MNQNEHYYDDGGGAIAPASYNSPTNIMVAEPLSIAKQDSRNYRKTSRRAEDTATHEHFRARLAGHAIVQAGGVIQVANAVADAIPNSSQAVYGIASTFAQSAAERIARW